MFWSAYWDFGWVKTIEITKAIKTNKQTNKQTKKQKQKQKQKQNKTNQQQQEQNTMKTCVDAEKYNRLKIVVRWLDHTMDCPM